MHVLRVFVGADGGHGNPLGVELDTADMDDEVCQEIARTLGYSETVFVDDPASGTCRIFTPTVSLPFAGHPMVGTAWLLARQGYRPDVLRPPAGPVPYGRSEIGDWVQAPAAWCPPWRLHELVTVDEVDRARPGGDDARDVVWAWSDRDSSSVRARVFGGAFGIAEDEATGSAAIVLAVHLDRPLVITQGQGSRLGASPVGDGAARVGGRVALDSVRAVEHRR